MDVKKQLARSLCHVVPCSCMLWCCAVSCDGFVVFVALPYHDCK